MLSVQEHDTQMAVTLNKDDKASVNNSITRAASKPPATGPWPPWVENIRLWSVPTIAIALVIFTLNEWSKYVEFRTHTNDSLETIQASLRALRISNSAVTPNNPASQAEAKAVIVEAKKIYPSPFQTRS